MDDICCDLLGPDVGCTSPLDPATPLKDGLISQLCSPISALRGLSLSNRMNDYAASVARV